MSTEIPIWVNGEIRWISGIDKKTTCKDVVHALLEGDGIDKSEFKDFTIIERWRKVERPLDENSKILKIWSHWGYEKKEVRLCLRRLDSEVDSGRGSPIGSGSTPSIKRKKNRLRGGKPPWMHPEALHPRRLAQLDTFNKKECRNYYKNVKSTNIINEELTNQGYAFNKTYSNYSSNENVNFRQEPIHKSYHCPGTGKLHSTPLTDHTNSREHIKRTKKCCSKRESKHKVRNSENIEKLMKLILAQGATIQSQLEKLKERDEQIESLEQERHRERIEKNGRNYLLETYLGSLKEAEIPNHIDEEERAYDSGVNTEGGSDQMNAIKKRNLERLKQNETEFDLDENEKICEVENLVPLRQADNLSDQSQYHYFTHSLSNANQRATRSKSESRPVESKKVTLKRTLSENSIANTGSSEGTRFKHCERTPESETNLKAKEESLEVIELKKIQSQIHMWEKVFKINKKLEREEENLVRLHIKMKKIKNEAKEKVKSQESLDENIQVENEAMNKKSDDETDKSGYKENYSEIQRNLEFLKTNLDRNSKEIYENFTKLIEEDEKVEQKRNCLTKLLHDLERTNHEEDMLNEMISAKETQRFQSTGSQTYKFEENQNFLSDGNYVCSEIYSTPQNSSEFRRDVVNQSRETELLTQDKSQLLKPKTLKISFEDEIQGRENLESDQEKLNKHAMPAVTGALKGILKNRNQSYNKEFLACNNESETNQTFPENCNASVCNNNSNKNYRPNYYLDYGTTKNNVINTLQSGNVPQSNTAVNPQVAVFPHICNQSLYEYKQSYFSATSLPRQDNIKTAFSDPCDISKPNKNISLHSTIVKSKASILNDNDSSTSSDTSGLCSMYSSSPSVEPYIENSYILDTLV